MAKGDEMDEQQRSKKSLASTPASALTRLAYQP
jgi:hypothetical protein